jgi:hypothetical protein
MECSLRILYIADSGSVESAAEVSVLERRMQKAGILEAATSDVNQDDVAARWERNIDRLISLMDDPEKLAKLALLVSAVVRASPLLCSHLILRLSDLTFFFFFLQEQADK